MTYFLDFRTSAHAGDILPEPHPLDVDGFVDPPAMRSFGLGATFPSASIAGRDLVFATHGFNVSRSAGIHALSRLERELRLPPRFVYIGVLWPGDFWIPVVNYPAEAADAVQCGQKLALFIDGKLGAAGSVSFVSHSLGGRLFLETVKRLKRKAAELCVLAAAVDDNCLTTEQYTAACANAQRVSVLASKGDFVLRFAYPTGDFLSDVLYDDDDPFLAALGYHGPRPLPSAGTLHAQIPGTEFGHFDYLPSSNLGDVMSPKNRCVASFIAETLLGVPHAWP